MVLTKEYIHSLYSIFKYKAADAISKRKYDTALKFLSAACHTAYTFYIGFRDEEIEDMLKKISGKIVKGELVELSQDRVVLYDTFSQDSQGLTMQYLDAIIASGKELLYVTEFNLDDPRSKLIKQTLLSYAKAEIVSVPSNLKGLKRVQMIYDTIIRFRGSKLFIHVNPSSVNAVAAFYALPEEITRYQINLTDHTYWVGAGCMDYIFDWRQYGASLSAKYRGFRKEQILMLPYYPMMKEAPFEGFPIETDGKVRIFAGASYYKIIDGNDSFFKINKAILDANPEAVTIFAGGGNRQILDDLIEKYSLKGRFIPIGQRNDIFQCFKHSDIYLSTYPLFGGLMGQFAAHVGLPMLALQKPGGGLVEECVCQKTNETISFPDFESLVKEASHLVRDESYRHQQGNRIKNCVISIEEFNEGFASAIKTNSSPFPVAVENDFETHYLNVEDKLKLENANGSYLKAIFMILGINCLGVSPKLWMDGVKSRILSSRFFS